jgi:general secretion pathway protein G
MRPTRHAFTLIELLIVVAIIAILAAIAVPNFLEAQTRAKVSRAKNDLRTLATALEAYNVDNNAYPPGPPALPSRFRRQKPLTTPIAYITSVPRDPFMSDDASGFGPWRSGLYSYGAMPLDAASRWALASDGPDRNDDCGGLVFYPGYTSELFFGGVTGFDYTLYDPTNGTVSDGDIFRASDVGQLE